MQFHLNINAEPFAKKISAGQGLFLLGSCFTEEIGNKLLDAKLHTYINSHGILFNPISLARSLDDCIGKKEYSKTELSETNATWHSWNHHSRFNQANPENYLSEINTRILSANTFIKRADWLIVTFGTAHAYKLISNGNIVGNCHKAPATLFEKVLLTVNEIVATWTKTLDELGKLNPGIKIIFTLSPVRYLRDGIVESNLSKAILLLAIHQLKQQRADRFYFPAYELIIDDLRDYRFYKDDLTHPNAAAVNYVWEKFISAVVDDSTTAMIEEVEKLNKFLQHKTMSSNPGELEKHENKKSQLLASLRSKFPKLNWE